MIPIGTLKKKIDLHPETPIKAPPTDGPSANPIGSIAVRIPILCTIFSFETKSPKIAKERAMSTAPPTP